MRRPPIGSSEKKNAPSDVHLSQIMDITNEIKLDSPLRESENCLDKRDYRDRDVKVEEILNAPSLSISLQTATEASAFLAEENAACSFLRSDDKKHDKYNSFEKTYSNKGGSLIK